MSDATLSARLDTADAERRAKELADELRKLGKAGHEMEGGLDDASRSAKEAGGSFDGLKATIATAVTLEAARRVAVFAAELVTLGASVAETSSKFETVFGPSVEGVSRFLDDFATKAGLSNSEAQGLIATAGAIAQGMGFAQAESAGFAEEIVRLSADLGSFNNLPTEDVARRVTAALTGEREGLKQLGIVVNEAAVQQRALANTGKDSVDALTQQEKATATLEIVTERAGTAIGDLERTQDSLANQQRAVGASLKTFREELALSAVEGFEASGVMEELRDVLERIDGVSDIASRAFEALLTPVAAFAQKIEEAQIAAEGWTEVMEALGNVREVGLRQTIRDIAEINDSVKEQVELSREEFEARKAARAEQEALKEAIEEAAAATEREGDAAKNVADETERAAEAAERFEAAMTRHFNRRDGSRHTPATPDIAPAMGGVNEFFSFGFDIEPLRELPDTLEAVERGAEEAAAILRALADAEASKTEKVAAAVGGVVSLGTGLGMLDENTEDAAQGIASIVQGISTLKDATDNVSTFSGAAGIIGGTIGLLGGLFSDEDTKRVEEARREFEGALDAFVGELSDSGRWEKLREEAEARARETLDALVDSALAGLPDKIRDETIRDIQDAFDSLDTEKLKEALAQFGPDGQKILDAYLSRLEAINEQRQAEVAAMSDDIAVRTLIAEGRTDEAEALQLQLERQSELAEARALEDGALLDLLETLYELEDAARAAAEAARDAALAQDFRDDLRVRGASGDEAELIRLQIRQAKEIANAKKLLEDGIITEEDFAELTRILGDEWQEIMAAMAEATTEALEKEMDLIQARKDAILAAEEDLEIRKLLLKGMTDEAAIRRLEIKQRDEYNDAVEAGFDDEFLEDLQQVQADEMAAFIKSLRDAAQATSNGSDYFASGTVGGGITEALDVVDSGSASITAIANTDAAMGIFLAQLRVLQSIDRNTASIVLGGAGPVDVGGSNLGISTNRELRRNGRPVS